MFLGVRGGPGTSPIDGESKKIWTVLFSNFFELGEAGSDPKTEKIKKMALPGPGVGPEMAS